MPKIDYRRFNMHVWSDHPLANYSIACIVAKTFSTNWLEGAAENEILDIIFDQSGSSLPRSARISCLIYRPIHHC